MNADVTVFVAQVPVFLGHRRSASRRVAPWLGRFPQSLCSCGHRKYHWEWSWPDSSPTAQKNGRFYPE